MKIKETIFNDLNLDKCYSGYNLNNIQAALVVDDILDNANAGGAVTCKPYNSKNT